VLADLLSDTLTAPSAAMRDAMAHAPVGDDVFGEDPTVRALEERVADLLGHEAGLFAPSGSLANQLGLRLHVGPGQELVADQQAHVLRAEMGAGAVFSGITSRSWPSELGLLDPAGPMSLVTTGVGPYQVETSLVVLENTHNFGGGTVQPIGAIREVRAATQAVGVAMHLDGARLWNAHVASGVSLRDYGAEFDTVSVCLSKGLGAPVGSALAGPRAFITRARRFKAQFGGGFRQAGIIAAGALFGLRNNRQRLGEDHVHAKLLAERIAPLPGVELDPATVETNILRFSVTSIKAGDLAFRLHDLGLHVLPSGDDGIRMIPHLNHTRKDVEAAAGIVERVMREIASSR